MSAPLLEIDDLRVHFSTDEGVVRAVDGVSLEIAEGEMLGIVGESGSGKSVASLTVLGLTRAANAEITGQISFEGQDLTAMDDEGLRRIRGNGIAMIFQDPLSALHPFYRVGNQLVEAIQVHRDVGDADARARAVELLELVGIPDPGRRMGEYPHELSGGMRQRAMIAMALACRPALLVADEPTTALDATVQAQIMALLGELRRQTGLALLLITHDLRLVARVADDVHIMYAGRIVESGPVAEVLGAPRHPYTAALLRTLPGWGGDAARGNAPLGEPRRARLPVIPGEPAHAHRRPGGCAFHPRCEVGKDDARCRAEVPPVERRGARSCACFKELSSERVGALV